MTAVALDCREVWGLEASYLDLWQSARACWQ